VQDPRGIVFLTEQMDALERERDALLEKSQRLEMLQRSFVEIIEATDETKLAEAAMRGAYLGLGFRRSLWFRIDGVRELSAQFELDNGVFVDSIYGGTLPEASSLFRVTSGHSTIATGHEGDPDAPLLETRWRYAAMAIRPPLGAAYLFYADDNRAGSAWSLESLRELAAQATFALERLRQADELERLAMRDPLTGLFNRRAMMERLQLELATARRTGAPLAFAMIDVDNFKSINDSRGHAGGDEALVTIATALRTQTRETDIPARFAGDEFALIMPRTNGADVATVMGRIYDALAANGLGISVGVAFDDGTSAPEPLIALADAGVYEAKGAGKNTYRIVGNDA
jgi:diguanylate cyclase (GGDEF)-like protein